MNGDLKERLALIKMILLDNDGVLTDGTLYYGGEGVQFVAFNVKDGLGIKLAHKAGIKTGIISGLSSEALASRVSMLGVSDLYMNVSDKRIIYEEIKQKHDLQDGDIAFIGDDVLDIPILKRCGMAVVVADAHPEAKKMAHLITTQPGGKGAVREFIDLVLEAKGIYDIAYKQFKE
jgi:3-deoxy-D-manno-octulosonate 8-phosphate phosphatase (KDO 8-P phosphatase)